MKDDRRLVKVAKGSDVHLELKGVWHVDAKRCVVKGSEYVEEEEWVGGCKWQITSEYRQTNC